MSSPGNLPHPCSPHAALALSADARFSRVDGEGCLFDLRRGRFLGLNRLAALLLESALTTGAPQAVATCARLWRRPVSEVQDDLAAMTGQLGQAGLLHDERGSASMAGRSLTRAAEALFGGVVRLVTRRGLGSRRSGARLVRRTLGLSWLGLRLFGLERSLEIFGAAAVAVSTTQALQHVGIEEIDDLVQGEARRMLLSAACKERAVTAWFLLKLRGEAPRLVIGLQRHPFRAHAWVQHGGRILTDTPEHCEFYVPVAELP